MHIAYNHVIIQVKYLSVQSKVCIKMSGKQENVGHDFTQKVR